MFKHVSPLNPTHHKPCINYSDPLWLDFKHCSWPRLAEDIHRPAWVLTAQSVGRYPQAHPSSGLKQVENTNRLSWVLTAWAAIEAMVKSWLRYCKRPCLGR